MPIVGALSARAVSGGSPEIVLALKRGGDRIGLVYVKNDGPDDVTITVKDSGDGVTPINDIATVGPVAAAGSETMPVTDYAIWALLSADAGSGTAVIDVEVWQLPSEFASR